ECKSESQDLEEHVCCNRSNLTTTDSPGGEGSVLKDRNGTVLKQLFGLFLDLHQRSDGVEDVPPDQSHQVPASPRRLREDASPRLAANETGTEFGAPVSSDLPEEDVAILVSVLLTTSLVFLCFLALLVVKCCAELCCIDLLYCMSHSCCRKPPDQVVVVRVAPKVQSLEHLLHNSTRFPQQ
ncbi:unnamed protein product, partial [Ixodes hexagonus]